MELPLTWVQKSRRFQEALSSSMTVLPGWKSFHVSIPLAVVYL